MAYRIGNTGERFDVAEHNRKVLAHHTGMMPNIPYWERIQNDGPADPLTDEYGNLRIDLETKKIIYIDPNPKEFEECRGIKEYPGLRLSF